MMDSEFLWSLFQEPGLPEVYLLYRKALREAQPLSA